MEFDFLALAGYGDLVLRGAVVSLLLTALITASGLVLAVFFVTLATYANKPLKLMVAAYVEAIRNTPFLAQMYLIFYGLPLIGLTLNEYISAYIALTVYLAAYATEIIRAGVKAVPEGQIAASLALGMTRARTFVDIVLPQALRKIFPALKGQVILAMLTTSIVSQIAVRELTFEANFIQGRSFRSFEIYIVVAIVYIFLVYLVTRAFDIVGHKIRAYDLDKK